MPIAVTDYSWTQTADTVQVVVPLKGVRGAKTDIYTCDVYLKVRECLN